MPLYIAPVAYEFKFVRTVEFSETDMAGIVHFSNSVSYTHLTLPTNREV